MPSPPAPVRAVFERLESGEETFIGRALRQETVGGVALLVATAIALIWANSPWADAYESLRGTYLGPLTVGKWAADGLLAIFFYIAGLELKRELVVGSLRRIADALVPVAAAVGGMVIPALLYLAVVIGMGAGGASLDGWAVPVATDIAFALAVLALVGRQLPSSLRAFLLTLAIVDDLGAILVIAVFFTDTLHLGALSLALLGAGVFAVLQQRRFQSRWLYIPLALAVWWFTYESGVHATIAGVALGLLTRVRNDPGEEHSPAERLEHRIRPISAGFAVPVFALFAAGVQISGVGELISDPVTIGIVVGLVVGKPLGIVGGAFAMARLTRAELATDLGWGDVGAVGMLAGMGFTVSLLIAQLAFPEGQADDATTAVLVASLLAAVLAAVMLLARGKVHSRAAEDTTAAR
ncbi:MAG TPA: Na+/H+ antiporter NhaA [Nocardioidaceae bacterium]|nr:Na+/H+ antiporter NhaA [Nocardioidaceae bacterium]